MSVHPAVATSLPIPAARPRRALRGGLRVLSLAFSAVPRRLRFHVAVRFARAAGAVMRHVRAYRALRVHPVESPAELALVRVLYALDRAEVEFQPAFEIDGREHLDEAVRAPAGVLLVGPHTMLCTLLVRHIHEAGRAYSVLAVNETWPITGTPVRVPTLRPSRSTLLAVRRRLARGDIVCTMLDMSRPRGSEGRLVRFETGEGPILMDDGLFHVAARMGAGVLFTAARLERGRVVVSVRPPSPHVCSSGQALTAEFIAFVRDHVRDLARR